MKAHIYVCVCVCYEMKLVVSAHKCAQHNNKNDDDDIHVSRVLLIYRRVKLSLYSIPFTCQLCDSLFLSLFIIFSSHFFFLFFTLDNAHRAN